MRKEIFNILWHWLDESSNNQCTKVKVHNRRCISPVKWNLNDASHLIWYLTLIRFDETVLQIQIPMRSCTIPEAYRTGDERRERKHSMMMHWNESALHKCIGAGSDSRVRSFDWSFKRIVSDRFRKWSREIEDNLVVERVCQNSIHHKIPIFSTIKSVIERVMESCECSISVTVSLTISTILKFCWKVTYRWHCRHQLHLLLHSWDDPHSRDDHHSRVDPYWSIPPDPLPSNHHSKYCPTSPQHFLYDNRQQSEITMK